MRVLHLYFLAFSIPLREQDTTKSSLLLYYTHISLQFTKTQMASTEDLALDLEELKQLRTIAKRPRVVSLISSQIRNLEELTKEAASAPAPHTPAPVSAVSTATPISSAPKAASNPLLTYATLGSFSWDQDNDKLKIYVSLEGVDQEKIEADFKPMSFDIKFHDVQVKASKGNWLDLHFKEDKLKPSLDKEKDPMAGIMDLMKNMYEEGDEEMKRTIAKAWSDARSGKTADPLKGYP
ncbi:UNVERIFIED_CONTAM: Calcyclin-binding protein [Sesamum angustifolium]|uniref:Calcyclin-binding protein n=1 Tax=Sesamum angustifolium TaxID=2727405 RepID=A0AAW2PD06_9LAMI